MSASRSALFSLIAVALLALVAYIAAGVGILRVAFGVVIPLLAFAVFIFGIIWKMWKWARVPVPFRIPTVSGQAKSLPWIRNSELESPSGLLGVLGRMALEVLFFRSLFRNTTADVLAEKQKVTYTSSKWLWLAGMAFHWTMLVIVIRHFRFFIEPVPTCLQILQDLDGFLQIGVPAIYASTGIFLAALLFLLGRRLFDAKVRFISLPSDYFALFLLLAIGTSGGLMRHLTKLDIIQVKAVVAGWFSLQFVPLTGVDAMFFIHIFLVSILLIYLPFSKLLHMPGVFFSPTRNLANNNRARRHINPFNPEVEGHTYAEWEDEYRDKLIASGYELDKE